MIVELLLLTSLLSHRIPGSPKNGPTLYTTPLTIMLTLSLLSKPTYRPKIPVKANLIEHLFSLWIEFVVGI